jgi:metallo-beta-lactamase family protein
MKLTFWGAARTVTGSMHEVTVDGRRYLLDCGLFQGHRQEAFERNRDFPFPPRTVAGVVLSHAHIDHSGNLPSLAKGGYGGPVHATPATVDLCKSMLLDSAYLQERDAEFVNRRNSYRKNSGPAVKPLYTIDDARALLDLMREHGYHAPVQIADGLTFEFGDAGHLLGSAWVLLRHRKDGKETRLLFSGDLGRNHMPIIRDPEPAPEADYLILESTYGGRIHGPAQSVKDTLAGVVARTAARGGRIIIPAFAVGRTQQIVLLLRELAEEKRIPNIPIFVDSPLAVNATDVYRRHPECYDAETANVLQDGADPFGFHRLRYIREVAESKALNELRTPFVVISASGMAEAGRILHHLRNNIEDPRNTVLIVGFQAEHTLGRKLFERREEVPIFGELMRLRAAVVTINELSGHGDQADLLEWMGPAATSLKGVFLVHGEPLQSEALKAAIQERYGLETTIPGRGNSFDLA